MPTDLRNRLAVVSAQLRARTRSENEQVGQLERQLSESLITEAATDLVPRELSIERAGWYSPEALSAARRRRIDDLIAAIDRRQPPRFRAFRRETPLTAPPLDLATPPWGRGAAIAQTLGPFDSQDGRKFWFDFFPIVRLVPIYLAGDAQPALLIHLQELRLNVGDALPLTDILRLLATQSYRLAAGSVWIRANLLAAGAPAGGYVGLRIGGGTLAFTPPPVDIGGRLTIPVGGRCAVALELPAPAVPAGGAGRAGIDAAQATIALPQSFSFVLETGRASITQLAGASWKLYGQDIAFTWAKTSPTYEPLLQSVLVPQTASVARVKIEGAHSPFASVAAEAQIERAGWTLPVATIDINNPTEAAGAGGLAVATKAGLTLGWRGLHDGPVRLRAPWLALWPGLIFIVDPQASNRYAHQRFLLWKDASSQFRSELDLQYTDAFLIVYVAAAAGGEFLLAAADADARIDRPVDVTGTPLPIRTTGSLLALAYTDAAQFVFFYEDDILVDSLDPNATWPLKPGGAISLALRNALFTVTPVNSLLLFGELRDEEMVKQAIVLLGMGLFGLLPTLPDPYAANIAWLRRRLRGDQRIQKPTLLLVGAVSWTKAASDDEPDAVDTNFAFAPLGPQADTMAEWTAAAKVVAASGGTAMPRAAAPIAAVAAAPAGESNEAVWNRYFQWFELEQFALLDVSSNADQLGVSFAWYNSASAEDRDYTYFRTFLPKGAQQASPAFPLRVQQLDLSAQSRYVRAFTLPLMSWEPLFNLTLPSPPPSPPPPPPPPIGPDPPFGPNLYPNDGGPTRLFNDSVELVPIAPIPVTEFLVKDFETRQVGFTGALFTLPFGLKAFAEFSRQNQFVPGLDPAKLRFNSPQFDLQAVKGGIQLRVDAPRHPAESSIFAGSTMQLDNVLRLDGSPSQAGTLGGSVGYIFNKEFFFDAPIAFKPRGVPLTRIDFCGYGASIFSHWQNPNAAIAATSQAHFDVFVGRTAQEVIQVRSLVYPWGIRVVRTITIFRVSDGYAFRFDSGWQAESDGVYDFRYNAYDSGYNVIAQPNPYEFHPGIVKGVFSVRNIRETDAVANFFTIWNKQNGDTYIDVNGILRTVDGGTLSGDRNPVVELRPVYFDADVAIDDVTTGARGGRVPSKGMLGYVQLSPRGQPISPDLFAQLLLSQFGAIGGPVDCVIDIAKSHQLMRLSRVDVNASQDTGSRPIFVSAARGAMVLPKDGSWSVVQHNQGTGEVSPVDANAAVPVIRRGKLDSATQTTDSTPADWLRIANPIDVVQPSGPATRNYGLLQSTGTQKALFRLPSFAEGVDQLLVGAAGGAPDFADAYRIVNSAGIFPTVQDALPLALGTFQTKILAEGYKLVDQIDPTKVFELQLPDTPLYLVNEQFLKIYVEYAKKDKTGATTLTPGRLRYGFDATANELGKRWLSKVNDIGMVVDLGPLPRLLMIKGKFDAQKGADPAFTEPELDFSDALKPVIEILQILTMLQGGDYANAFAKGLEIAMSNSADSWNYAFHARKQFPLVKFPPSPASDDPEAPLKLECQLSVGVYFNEVLKVTNDSKDLIPSAGAFLEFGGRLSVMCVSLAAATVYATGSVDLRTAADIKTGPSLHMKFGFGAELVVGLPVIGNVSLLYMVGIEITLETSDLTVSAFLMFRGRAELLGGMVTVTIMIEAKGTYQRLLGPPAKTDLSAQVTFGLDISIFLVINIHFSQSWQETRQIA
jgi:hypothetical protein